MSAGSRQKGCPGAASTVKRLYYGFALVLRLQDGIRQCAHVDKSGEEASGELVARLYSTVTWMSLRLVILNSR